MIVTKQIADETLTPRASYLIEPDTEGAYRIVSITTCWKEGMEVFETREECIDEISRRLKLKSAAGKCPRCELKRLIETEQDITKLDLVKKIKGGAFYHCSVCDTIWHKAANLEIAQAYDVTLSDHALAWSERDLQPTKEMEAILHKIKDISNDKNYRLFPAHITLTNGLEFPYSLIRLEMQPPPSQWFHKSDWFYLDEIATAKPSPYAYPFEIAKHIITFPTNSVYIKDLSDNKIYYFDAQAGVFMPEKFREKVFQLMDAKKMTGEGNLIMTKGDHGMDFWTTNPPPLPTLFWGDMY